MADKKPDTDLASAIRQLQDEIDGKIAILEALRSNYNPAEIDYHKYIKTTAWEKQREKTFKRDGFKCVLCGEEKNLECHHITYDNLGAEKVSDLATLCKECHAKLHGEDDCVFMPAPPTKMPTVRNEFMCLAYAMALGADEYSKIEPELQMMLKWFEHLNIRTAVGNFHKAINTNKAISPEPLFFFNTSLKEKVEWIKEREKPETRLYMYKTYLHLVAINGIDREIESTRFDYEDRDSFKRFSELKEEIDWHKAALDEL